MYSRIFYLFWVGVLVNECGGQGGGGGVPVPPVGSEYIDRGPDGSYRYGFQTGDDGGHYHAAVASKDNQVAGRFGSRDPASGRVAETQYTAGQRGFRARGPNIARRQDLSQTKLPYNPPVDPSSPNYKPTYDTYHDPNEDPSYNFGFRTPNYVRNEKSDSRGRVDGTYSFVDDVGERHDVRYEAGARIGFNVRTPFPDSKPFSGLFYTGPTKPGGLPRGKTSIQQSGDGSYRFVSAGPDQRRAEVSDALGNVRGSYTYIDDKGQQRTVEYIAGPNIGYKVINKGIGPKFPPIPAFTPPQNLFPNFPSKFEELNPNNFAQGGGNVGGPGGPGSAGGTGGPVGGGGSGGDSFDGLFGEGGGGAGAPPRPTPGSPTQRPTSFGTTPSPATGGSSDLFGDLDIFSSPTKPPGSGGKPPGSQTTPSLGTSPGQGEFPGYPGGRPGGGSQGGAGNGGNGGAGGSLVPGDLPNNCCPPGSGIPFTTPASSGEATTPGGGGGGSQAPFGGFEDDLFGPISAFPEDDPSAGKPRPTAPPSSSSSGSSEGDDFLDAPFPDISQGNYNDYNKKPSSGESVGDSNESKDDNTFLSSNKNFYGFPPGVSVKARVQSLDILPFGSRIPPPGLALDGQLASDG